MTSCAPRHSGGHCKKLAPTWDELAVKYNAGGEWKIAKVDCTTEKTTCAKYGVKGYPTLKALKDGTAIDYAGGRSIDQFDKFLAKNGNNAPAADPAAGQITKNDKGLYKITDDNIDAVAADKEHSYFIKFFAPWCGHCKAMAAEWETYASTNPDAKLRIAEADCTTDGAACKKHGVRGYPTVLLFNGGKEPVKYQGARNKAGFDAFWESNKPGAAGKTEL